MILSRMDLLSAGIVPSSSLPGVLKRTSVGARQVANAVVVEGECDSEFACHTPAIRMAAAAAINSVLTRSAPEVRRERALA